MPAVSASTRTKLVGERFARALNDCPTSQTSVSSMIMSRSWSAPAGVTLIFNGRFNPNCLTQLSPVGFNAGLQPPVSARISKGTCPYRNLYPAILVMKSAEDRPRGELTEPLDRPMGRRILAQRKVSSELVVVT